MPLPDPRHVWVYVRKGVELALRTAGQAPEIRMARRLRSQAVTEVGGPRVLFVCPKNWVEHVQDQAMLAQALRLRGADVEFATCGGGLPICDRSNVHEGPPMPCRTCTRYTSTALDAHGFVFGEIVDPNLTVQSTWADLDELSVRELLDTTFGTIPLGRLVEAPLKWFLCSADIDNDPLAAPTLRRFLRAGRQICEGANRLLDSKQPHTVVVLGKKFLFDAIIAEVCRQRDIHVINYERGYRKDTLVFSHSDPAGWYLFDNEWESRKRPLEHSEEAQLDHYLSDRQRGVAFGQWWHFDESSGDHSQRAPTAVLFPNVTWDTAVVGREGGFASIQDWVDQCIDAFSSRPDDHLVIRCHPSEVFLPGRRSRDSLFEYVTQTWDPLPDNVSLIAPDDPTDSYELMTKAELGLVFTSTVGLEMALLGKPVLVAAETHYRGKGFTVDIDGPTDLHEAIQDVARSPSRYRPDLQSAREYAHFFLFRGLFPAPQVVEPLPGLARIDTNNLNDLAVGRDPALDRLCNAILHHTSFYASTDGRPA